MVTKFSKLIVSLVNRDYSIDQSLYKAGSETMIQTLKDLSVNVLVINGYDKSLIASACYSIDNNDTYKPGVLKPVKQDEYKPEVLRPVKQTQKGRTLEHIISNTYIDLPEKLIHFMKTNCDESCEELLIAIFDSSSQGVQFDTNQTRAICQKLRITADDIFTFLFNFGFDFDPMYGLLLLKYRSAVQLMFEIYSKVPVDGDKLFEELKKLIETTDTLQVLDEAIENFLEVYLEFNFTKEELCIPANISKDHTWWLVEN